MVLFCFGGMVSKSFDGDKYAVSETSLNLQIYFQFRAFALLKNDFKFINQTIYAN